MVRAGSLVVASLQPAAKELVGDPDLAGLAAAQEAQVLQLAQAVGQGIAVERQVAVEVVDRALVSAGDAA